ncbi:MAG: hypothetical protein A2X36_14475 [Elusimicrobia bacterium GWA2_69_24]|nr:MAG: hypothetical protein A2X36_14475 [Elusimicrobia bacterium GWA2_69_24]HBL18401.1 hypothetical protein [Elusimicrobiota bacterium]
MRYWLCVRGRVSGPFSPEELAANPDFRAAALVCPEERPDRAQPWTRADRLDGLRSVLPPDYHLTTPGGGREPAWLPRDPTISDAAAAHSLEDGIRALEARLTAALERLRNRDVEQAALKRDIRRKETALNALRRVLSALTERLQALAGMHEALRATQERIGSQGDTLDDFRQRLHGIRLETAAALSTAEEAARRTAAEARALVAEAQGQVEAALRAAAEALDAASKTEMRAAAAERLARRKPGKSRRSPRPPSAPGDLDFPDPTSIDGL